MRRLVCLMTVTRIPSGGKLRAWSGKPNLSVILWTAAPNEGAQGLFRGLGFRDTMLEMTLELEE